MIQNFSDLIQILEAHEPKRYSFDRIPRAAQPTYEETGNEILKAATAVAETSHRSVRQDQEEFSEIPERGKRVRARLALAKIIKPIEADNLLKWARRAKVLLDNDVFDREWMAGGKRGETENEIYYDESSHRWMKRNNMLLHSTYLEFFHRVAMHNYLFSEAPLRLEGFVVNQGELMPIMSQPHVQADRGATKQEVIEYMKKMGFRHVQGVDFHNPTSGITIKDLHDENVLVSPDGHLHIIDPLIYLDDEGKSHRLSAYADLQELDQ